jgi:hypothetical protein
MTRAQRFWTGVLFVLLSAAIYAVHHAGGQPTTLFDVVWHGGMLMSALALLVPRDQYRAILDFLGSVLRRDKAP